MRRIDLTREPKVATRPLAPPSEAFQASIVEAARATTGLHELYVLQYSAPSLSPPRGVLFAILAAPGADVGAIAREFEEQIALRFDRTDAFHYTVGTTANAALIPHCVLEALWHRTRFTERPAAPWTVGGSVPPPMPPAPRVPRVAPTPLPSTAPPPPKEPPAATTLADLVNRHALVAWDRQEWHLEVHEGCAAALDLALGELSLTQRGLFGKKLRYRAQILGAEQGRSWHWAWAIPDGGIPEPMRSASHSVRRRGDRERVHELVTGALPLGGPIAGDALAAVACGLTDATFWLRVPTDDGALFVLVTDPSFPRCDHDPALRALTTIPRAFASIEIPDHRAAVRAYFAAIGLRVDARERELIARSPSGRTLRAELDERGRLVVLESI